MQVQTADAAFPALLKSADGKLLEVGNGVIFPEEQTIEFHSEFVQLFKMDTVLKIVRLQNEAEVLSFTGQVYLSSPGMLRLVGVRQEILPAAKEACVFPADIAGTVCAVPVGGGSLWSKLVRRRLAEITFPVKIYAVSTRIIHFTAPQLLQAEQVIRLCAQTPPLEEQTLKVNQVFAFGDHNNYHCAIQTGDATSLASLEQCVTTLCNRQLSFFPEG